MMSFLFDDDICWCLDVEKCGYEDCWRNVQHRKRCAEDYDIYTAAAFYGSPDCVHYTDMDSRD